MDRLSRFGSGSEVTSVRLTSDENKTLDDVTAELSGILTQLQATHAGHEEELWGRPFNVDEVASWAAEEGEEEFGEDR